MDIINPLYFKDRTSWRNWLKINYNKYSEVWLIYYKKHTGKKRIPYEDAVEEALCFGWIDSTVKRIDEEKFCQKFTPRRDRSNWSNLNKKRADKLILTKKMTQHGMAKINVAKNNGKWDEDNSINRDINRPDELIIELENNEEVRKVFNSLSHSAQRKYIHWIASAKKSETRFRRVDKVILMLNKK